MAAIDYFNAMQGVSERKDAAALQDIHIQQQRFDNILQNFAARRQQQQQFESGQELKVKELSMREKAMGLETEYRRGQLDIQNAHLGLARSELATKTESQLGQAEYIAATQGKTPEEIMKITAPETLSPAARMGWAAAKSANEQGLQMQEYGSRIKAIQNQDLAQKGKIVEDTYTKLTNLQGAGILTEMGVPPTVDLLQLSATPEGINLLRDGTRRLDAKQTSMLVQRAADLGAPVDLNGLYDEQGYVNNTPSVRSRLSTLSAFVEGATKKAADRAAGNISEADKARLAAVAGNVKSLGTTAYLPDVKTDLDKNISEQGRILDTLPGALPPMAPPPPTSASGRALVVDPKTGFKVYATPQ